MRMLVPASPEFKALEFAQVGRMPSDLLCGPLDGGFDSPSSRRASGGGGRPQPGQWVFNACVDSWLRRDQSADLVVAQPLPDEGKHFARAWGRHRQPVLRAA
jgi:hypothetical protein